MSDDGRQEIEWAERKLREPLPPAWPRILESALADAKRGNMTTLRRAHALWREVERAVESNEKGKAVEADLDAGVPPDAHDMQTLIAEWRAIYGEG